MLKAEMLRGCLLIRIVIICSVQVFCKNFDAHLILSKKWTPFVHWWVDGLCLILFRIGRARLIRETMNRIRRVRAEDFKRRQVARRSQESFVVVQPVKFGSESQGSVIFSTISSDPEEHWAARKTRSYSTSFSALLRQHLERVSAALLSMAQQRPNEIEGNRL